MVDTRGACVWLTGRSGAGKSTVTKELLVLLEQRNREVTVLDVVPELAKRRFERSSEGKLLRKAFVAREVARHGGLAICVTVSSRAAVRERARDLVGSDRFLEIFFATPRSVTKERKGGRTKKPPMLKRLRRVPRRVRSLFRTTDTFEEPESPDLVIDTSHTTPLENARALLRLLEERGFVDRAASDSNGAAKAEPAGAAGAAAAS